MDEHLDQEGRFVIPLKSFLVHSASPLANDAIHMY